MLDYRLTTRLTRREHPKAADDQLIITANLLDYCLSERRVAVCRTLTG
jgi:hypothetical protein